MTSATIDSPRLQPVRDAITDAADVHLRMLRLDLVHPLLQGNKWYKLRLNLEAARQQGHGTLLSFGGAYSNHLRALAVAGRLHGFRTIGIVRGETPEPLNPLLAFAQEQGMALHAVDRASYRKKHTEPFLAELQQRFGDFFLIPEGGANVAGALGCADIVEHLSWSVESARRHLMLACGTGTTLAGIIHGLRGSGRETCQATGVAVLKGIGINGESFLQMDVRRMLRKIDPNAGTELEACSWRVEPHWHCGGYAKTTPELLHFVKTFEESHQIPLEPVYTGKMMRGLYGKIAAGGFARGAEIIAIHTGGLHSR